MGFSPLRASPNVRGLIDRFKTAGVRRGAGGFFFLGGVQMVRELQKSDLAEAAAMLAALHAVHRENVPGISGDHPAGHFEKEAARISKDRRQLKLVYQKGAQLQGISWRLCGRSIIRPSGESAKYTRFMCVRPAAGREWPLRCCRLC